jgi:hypothetical protein
MKQHGIPDVSAALAAGSLKIAGATWRSLGGSTFMWTCFDVRIQAMFRELRRDDLPLREVAAARSPQRRRRVGSVTLDPAAVDSFLRLVERLGQLSVPLDADWLASTARGLLDRYPDRRTAAPCIRARLRVVTALRMMLVEPGWEPAPALALEIHELVAHLRERRPLIPRALPVIGRLDDAILVGALWPQLEGELRAYIAFRYLRRVEAELAHTSLARLGFTRRDWEQEWPALQGLYAHFRHAGLDSYTPVGLGIDRFNVC